MRKETVSSEEKRSEIVQAPWLRRAKLLQRVAAVLFSALPVLLLLFYLAPSAASIGMDGETIYQLFPDQTGLGSCAIGLIVLTCFAALFAVPLLLGEFNKCAHPLTPPFLIYATLIQTATLITAATLTGRIVALDGGLGVLKVGAAPILTIIFSGLAVILGCVYIALYFRPETRPPRPRRTYPKWLGYAFLGVFGVFAFGMFLFPIAPYAEMAGGAGESFYDLLATNVPRIPIYTDCAVALVVFACLGLLMAIFYLALFVNKKYHALPLSSALCSLCALAQTVISSVAIAQIGTDGGLGLTAGAAPILVLVFSLLAMLFGGAATVLPYALRNTTEGGPRQKDDMKKELEELKRRLNELQSR